jgi:hypothetical protein
VRILDAFCVVLGSPRCGSTLTSSRRHSLATRQPSPPKVQAADEIVIMEPIQADAVEAWSTGESVPFADTQTDTQRRSGAPGNTFLTPV